MVVASPMAPTVKSSSRTLLSQITHLLVGVVVFLVLVARLLLSSVPFIKIRLAVMEEEASLLRTPGTIMGTAYLPIQI